MEANTNISLPASDEEIAARWSVALQAFEIISIILLAVTSWLFLSMIVYGTKTKRWMKKPGSSSLNSGIIYSACTFAVLLAIPRLAVTEYIYILPRLDGKVGMCDLTCDVDNLLYSVIMYGAYAFMWLLQRKIYTHPYVKEKVGTAMNWLSRLFGIFLALIAVGLSLTYVLFNSYDGKKHGCVLYMPENATFIEGVGKNIVVASCLLVSQGTILCLCIYPVVRVKFDLGTGVSDSLEDSVFTDSSEKTNKPDKMRRLIKSCFKRSQKIAKSPIKNAARRAMIAGIIMVLSDVLALMTAFLALPTDVPVALRQTLYDISNVINLFCIVSSLGLGPKILMLCCPKCTEVIRRRSRSHNVYDYGTNENSSRAEGAV